MSTNHTIEPDVMEFRKRIARLLAELHADEVLSEQQCARYFGCDIVSWRRVEDSFSFGVSFVEGESFGNLPETSPVDDAIKAAIAAATGEQT